VTLLLLLLLRAVVVMLLLLRAVMLLLLLLLLLRRGLVVLRMRGAMAASAIQTPRRPRLTCTQKSASKHSRMRDRAVGSAPPPAHAGGGTIPFMPPIGMAPRFMQALTMPK
jgi:hypothetical protein